MSLICTLFSAAWFCWWRLFPKIQSHKDKGSWSTEKGTWKLYNSRYGRIISHSVTLENDSGQCHKETVIGSPNASLSNTIKGSDWFLSFQFFVSQENFLYNIILLNVLTVSSLESEKMKWIWYQHLTHFFTNWSLMPGELSMLDLCVDTVTKRAEAGKVYKGLWELGF